MTENMNENAQAALEERRDAQTLAYILPDENLFFATGYRVLQNQEKNGFLHCAKISQNGKIKLAYQIESLKALDNTMDNLSPEAFITVLTNLMQTILELKANGFMQCENVQLELNKIFVDVISYKTYLVYIPLVCEQNVNSFVTFESKLSNLLCVAIGEKESVRNTQVMAIYRMLKDKAPAEEILARLKSMQGHSPQVQAAPSYAAPQKQAMPPAPHTPHTPPAPPMYTPQAYNNAPPAYVPAYAPAPAPQPVYNTGNIPTATPAQAAYYTASPAVFNPQEQQPVQNVAKKKPAKKGKIIMTIVVWLLIAAGIVATYHFELLERKWELPIYAAAVILGVILSLFIGMIGLKSTKSAKSHKAPKASAMQAKQEVPQNPQPQPQNLVSNQPTAYNSAFQPAGAGAYPQPEIKLPPQPNYSVPYQDEKTEIGDSDEVYGETEIIGGFMPQMVLRGLNTPIPVELAITQREFLIGKNPKAVSGVLSFSKAISRVHCKISFFEGRYFITDMGSSNFTYVNGTQLEPKKQTEIHQNDCIRIADFDFSFACI